MFRHLGDLLTIKILKGRIKNLYCQNREILGFCENYLKLLHALHNCASNISDLTRHFFCTNIEVEYSAEPPRDTIQSWHDRFSEKRCPAFFKCLFDGFGCNFKLISKSASRRCSVNINHLGSWSCDFYTWGWELGSQVV